MKNQSTFLTIKRDNDIVIVHFSGHRITNVIDIQQIGEILIGILDAEQPSVLILDFLKVNYLPSAMLGKLAVIRNKVNTIGTRLKLANLQPPVEQLFKVTHLDKLFDIYKDVESSLSSKK